VARLQLGAERVLAGLLVREDLPAPGGGECVKLPLQLLAAGRDPGVSDLDLGADERFGDEEVRLVGRFGGGHGPGSCQKTVVRGCWMTQVFEGVFEGPAGSGRPRRVIFGKRRFF
jgi:hypothetical protein